MPVKIVRIDKKEPKISTEAMVMGADKLSFYESEAAVQEAIKDDEYWRLVKMYRDDPSKGWSKEKTMRRVAHIPIELYNKAIKLWGPEVFKDKKLFKKYFAKDEIGQWTLTVPKDTL